MKTVVQYGQAIRAAGVKCLEDDGDMKLKISRLKNRLEELCREIKETNLFHPWTEAADILSLDADARALLCVLWSMNDPYRQKTKDEALFLFLETLGVRPLPPWTMAEQGNVRLSPVLAGWLEEERPKLPSGVKLLLPEKEAAYGLEALLEEGRRLLLYAGQAEEPTVLCVCGRKGSGRQFYLEQLLASEGLALLMVDAPYFQDTRKNLEACMLCAQLYGAVVCVCAGAEPGGRLVEKISGRFHFCAVILEEGREPGGDIKGQLLYQKIPEPNQESRMKMAKAVLGEQAKRLPEGISVEQLAKKRLPAGAFIKDLKRIRAELLCGCFHPEAPVMTSPALRLLPANRTFAQLKLPASQYEKLKEISRMAAVRGEVMQQWGFAEKFSYGNGLSVLFYGAPGTGKTMAAQVLANALSLPLYQVDLSQLISKFIGETQKNIGRIFDEAGEQECILLFDEADAVFAKRSQVSDAQDRYSNAETAYLLQRIEQYTGITVLATNLLQNFDEAFRRRISYMVHFPMPDAGLRKELWEDIFPDDTPVSLEVDADLLAQAFELSGASIRNAAWHGALMARAEGSSVKMCHILAGIQNEYEKQGRTFPDIAGL